METSNSNKLLGQLQCVNQKNVTTNLRAAMLQM